jgi:hypothetical protein
MVSPVDKNGGQVDPPGAIAGGGVLQAAPDGGSVTYGSAASFGAGAEGAPPLSQYISRRGSGGWSMENITAPLYSGSYGVEPEGAPYQLFSGDLARGLLLNGRHCRGVDGDCAVVNPPLAGTGAPAGYQNYYLRESAGGGFTVLLTSSAASETPLEPARFELSLAGASLDLRHVVLSTCAALTPDAIEIPLGEGCDPDEANLYEWSGGGLGLVNLLPAQIQGAPGATLAAQSLAVSADGSRVYWSDGANLYLRAGGQTRQVDAGAGGGGAFQTAAGDGSVAFFTKTGHLYRYDAVANSSSDLTPAGGVQGVLGASEDGSHIYYATAAGVFFIDGGPPTKVAAGAAAGNYPPTTGSARVSPDGAHLAFVFSPGGGPNSGVYLYDAGSAVLTCASCRAGNPNPSGPSTIPGAVANGQGPEAIASYKPRALSEDGRRLFFDSEDAIVTADTNQDSDVYQWEAQGTGTCASAGGCVALISSGIAAGGASFVDASRDGADAFFLTDGSLVDADTGSFDLYDARVGGGFPVPSPRIPCKGDGCQFLPSAPLDPAVTTQVAGLGNPPVHYSGARKRCKRGQVRRHGKCVKKGHGGSKGQKRGGR